MDNKEKLILGSSLILILAFWLAILFKLATVFLPHGAYGPNQLEAANYRSIIPQGWAFFTRNPQEETYFLLEKNNDGQFVDVIPPNRAASNGFGIKRDSRIRGMELGSMILRAEEKPWVDCPLGYPDKMEQIDSTKTITVLNAVPHPTLCGEYLIVKKAPVPWAWGESYSKINMPAKAIKINAICYKENQP